MWLHVPESHRILDGNLSEAGTSLSDLSTEELHARASEAGISAAAIAASTYSKAGNQKLALINLLCEEVTSKFYATVTAIVIAWPIMDVGVLLMLSMSMQVDTCSHNKKTEKVSVAEPATAASAPTRRADKSHRRTILAASLPHGFATGLPFATDLVSLVARSSDSC